MSSALHGLLVVELTSGVAGAFAGKLLADLGADVVMVEPHGGSALRAHPLFDHLAGGKRSVVAADRASGVAATWVRAADVVLVDVADASLVADAAPTAVIIDVSPFGRTGPYRDWERSDLVTWAMGGYLSFTGAPDREPIWLPGAQAALHAGAHAAFAALVAVHERGRSGAGQRVEVSEVDAVLTAHAWLVSSWAACGVVQSRQPPDLIRASDGWVYAMRIVPRNELFVLIDRPDLAAEDLARDVPTWHANIPRIFEAVAEWAKDKTVAEIVEVAQLLRVAVTPIMDGPRVLADEQLEARDWWEREGDVAFPGQPYRFSASTSARRGSAPVVGAHTDDAPPPVDAGAVAAVGTAAADPGSGPLAGLRVIEVTTNWAGPVAGRFLADLGADSIKVEWATRPATRTLFWAGPFQDLQRQGHERSMYFSELNRNKRGVCIDLSKPDGRAAFLELVKHADVVLENNSARVMPNLGLSYDDLRAVNPKIIMVSMSGYGADGPHRDWVAYGANIEGTSSLTSITGYPDGQLSRTTLFYADPVSGNYAAIAIMAALHHRERTGEGQWVDISLNECGVTYCAEALLQLQRTGVARPPMANRDPLVAPQGAYRCIGTDNWVAITARDTSDWKRLAVLIGRDDLAGDASLDDLAARHARHDELDAAIAAWTIGREQYEVAHAVQAIGVPAAPVLANWQMLADPHFHERGMFQTMVHPVVGAYPTTTWPWRFSRTPARLVSHAPLFAQHNRAVLRDAGLDEEQIAALYASGTTADAPVVA